MILEFLLAAHLDTSHFVVVPAEPAHFEKVIELVNEAYQIEQVSFDKLKSIYFHPNSKLFVLIDKTKKAVAGTLEIDYSPKNGGKAIIGLFAVEKEYRRQNLGHLLLQHAEHFAKRLGKTEVALSVLRQNRRLINYYQNLGFIKSEDKFFATLEKSLITDNQ